MPSVVYWSGQPGGTAQYRCKTPGGALERLGWDVVYYDDTLDVAHDGRVRGDPDVLVICRVMGDLLPEIVQNAQRHGTTVIYDTDDWFLGVPDYNPASKLPAEDVAGMHMAMEVADLITVSTPGLADLYSPYGETVVLPNYLDPDVWTNNERYKMPHDGVRIGWVAAYRWRGGDIEVLRPWLPQFLDEHAEVRFVSLGSPELPEDLGINGVVAAMAPYESLPQMIGAIDIGLAPLEYNTFNWRGKSACKSMEYGAMGVPSVASPSEANRAYIEPGVNGYLVRKNEWAATVERAIDNLDTLRAGAKWVAERYFIDDHIGRWVDAYSQGRSRRHLGPGRPVSAAVS